MNILITIDRYLPEPLSSAVMIADLANEFINRGHEVSILTGDSNLKDKKLIATENGITIYKVRLPSRTSIGLARRLFEEIRLERRLWYSFRSELRANNFDLIISYTPTIFWSYILGKIKKKSKAKSYLVLRDIFPKWAVDTGIISKWNPVYWFLRSKEKKLYKLYDFIGVQSISNMQYFKSDSCTNRFSLEVLFNWKRIQINTEKEWGLRSTYNLDEKIIFIYGGNFGFAQDMDNLLRLYKNLKDFKNIHFVMVGEGSDFNKVNNWRECIELKDKLTIIPSVSDAEYSSILKECNIGLISLRKDFKTDNFPGKMLGYMENRLAILASVNPGNEIKMIIEDNDVGFVCDNGDDETLLSNAKEMIRNKSMIEKMGENGSKLLAKKFNVQSAADQILNKYLNQD